MSSACPPSICFQPGEGLPDVFLAQLPAVVRQAAYDLELEFLVMPLCPLVVTKGVCEQRQRELGRSAAGV